MTTFKFPLTINSYASPLALCKGYFWKCDDNGTFDWEKVGRKRLRGEISCVQTSCPQVSINVNLYENDTIVKHYSESTGWDEPEVTLGHQDIETGHWWFADYADDKLQTIYKGEEPEIFDDLEVDDSGMIIHNLDKTLNNMFE